MSVHFEKLEDVKEFLKNRFQFALFDVLDGLENSNLDIIPKTEIKNENNTLTFIVKFEKIKKG